ARGFQFQLPKLKEFGHGFFGGQVFGTVARAALQNFQAEAAAFVNFHHVDGDVLGREGDRFAERLAPRSVRLLWEAGDEIKADVVDASGVESGNGAVDVFAAMHAAGGFEFFIDKRLRAKTDAMEAGGGPLGGFLGVDGFRVGFESNFRKRAGEGIAQGLKHIVEEFRFEKARRAAAKVDGVHYWQRRAQITRKIHAGRLEQPVVIANLIAHGGSIGRKAAG